MKREKEKTWLFATLMALLLAIVVIVVITRMHRIVAWWVIAAVAAPWFALCIVLRVRSNDWGREGKVIDVWSVPHFVTGSLFALFGIGLGWVVPVAIVWELVEVFSHVSENGPNRVADVLLATAGWITANLVFGGSFPLV